MKPLLILLIIALSFSCCSKSTVSGKTFNEKIIGKWRYTQTYYSIGGPLIYISTDNLKQSIEFKADGSFTGNVPGFANATTYQLLDSSKVKFITPFQPDFRYYIFFDSTDNSLSLSPADAICIEGCGQKFKR